MANGDNLIAKVPLSWKKSFSQGVVIPKKLRNCNKRTKDVLCDDCDCEISKSKKRIRS